MSKKIVQLYEEVINPITNGPSVSALKNFSIFASFTKRIFVKETDQRDQKTESEYDAGDSA